MKKRNAILYWIFTGLLCAIMVMSAARYLIDIDQFRQFFINFGYNERIVLPLAIAKLLAVIAILTNKSRMLKEWAYAGLLFDFLLALEAHIAVGDNHFMDPIIALVLWLMSYLFYRKVYPTTSIE